jgi:hypothetical protein
MWETGWPAFCAKPALGSDQVRNQLTHDEADQRGGAANRKSVQAAA